MSINENIQENDDFEFEDEIDDDTLDGTEIDEKDFEDDDSVDNESDDDSDTVELKQRKALAAMNKKLREQSNKLKSLEKITGKSFDEVLSDYEQRQVKKISKETGVSAAKIVEDMKLQKRLEGLEQTLAEQRKESTIKSLTKNVIQELGLSKEQYQILQGDKEFKKILKVSLDVAQEDVRKTYLLSQTKKLLNSNPPKNVGFNANPNIRGGNTQVGVQTMLPAHIRTEDDYLAARNKNKPK